MRLGFDTSSPTENGPCVRLFIAAPKTFVSIPYPTPRPLMVPDALPDAQALFLTDILPTGYQAVLNAEVSKGRTLAIPWCGPVAWWLRPARACWAPNESS